LETVILCLGGDAVKILLQSGNAVFSARSKDRARLAEASVLEQLRLFTQLQVRRHEEARRGRTAVGVIPRCDDAKPFPDQVGS
jgi:uncharacterized protein (DUF1697 family)